MLKFIFLVLLLANGALFAFHQGHLEMLFPSGREPGRIANQLNADKFKLIPAPAATMAPAGNTPVAAGTPSTGANLLPQPAALLGAMQQGLTSCAEIGNFTTAEAKRFEAKLSESQISSKLSRRVVQETSSHMILIPPLETREAVDKKVNELRKMGITDFYVIQENTDHRWGISLGIFKTEEAARMRMAALNQQGMRSARLIEHKVPLNRVAFQVRNLEGQSPGLLAKIKAEFPRQELRSCE